MARGIDPSKWERATQEKGIPKWEAKRGSMPGNWAKGLAANGTPPGPVSSAAYQSGLANADYRGGVAGKGAKWAEGYRMGISR